ncbi:MAG: Uma2 family endonuclease [Gammaproteobacteria bacterium]|nr:Uma2 family endonuclease [Gammaproteobacteria bacterium]
MSSHALKHGHYTYQDYCAWSDDERWELIDGQAYNMSPAPTRRHQDVVMELSRQIANFLRAHPCRVYTAPFDVRLPRAAEADAQIDTVVQPDISVICDANKLDDPGCRGAPDWIIEVLSPGTAAKDQIRKRELFQRHGVKEYWLVHPIDRILTVYKLETQEYGKPDIRATEGSTEVATIQGFEIDWGFMAE